MRRTILTFAFAISATTSFAQDTPVQMPEPAPPSPTPDPPHCSDFKLNPDGTWIPRHPVTIGDVTISQKAAFQAGSVIGGVDLGTLLNQQCLQQP